MWGKYHPHQLVTTKKIKAVLQIKAVFKKYMVCKFNISRVEYSH